IRVGNGAEFNRWMRDDSENLAVEVVLVATLGQSAAQRRWRYEAVDERRSLERGRKGWCGTQLSHFVAVVVNVLHSPGSLRNNCSADHPNEQRSGITVNVVVRQIGCEKHTE